MFFKKKDKKPPAADPRSLWTEDGKFRLGAAMIPKRFVESEDGEDHRFDSHPTGNAPSAPSPVASEPVLERLYVISRDNINLEDAQDIVMYAAATNMERLGDILVSRKVPLLWASAYPDELFGEAPLPPLLLSNVRKQEGDKYLNNESKMLQYAGTYNGYEYYILALVSGV